MHEYAGLVPGARSLALAPDGTVFVGTRREGKVYALRDEDRDGRAERVMTIASGLDQPNGVAFLQGDLFVAEATRILRFPKILQNLGQSARPTVFFSGFPKQNSHDWKYLAAGADGDLYVSVGAPCNVCESKDPIQATILRLDSQARMRIYARGVRNSIGFDWHPVTKELWFTDNGRDLLGDDVPPDELNRASRAGGHFGFPYCHGLAIADPQFGKRHSCSEFIAPVATLAPHCAALGMRFYTGRQFPQAYRNQIFIAEHGSWNRSQKIGYRVSLVRIESGNRIRYEPFATGWLTPEGKVLGRPVDVLVMPDGALLVSDDMNGAVYRITSAL